MSMTVIAAKHGLGDVLFQILKSIAQKKKHKAEEFKDLAGEQFRDLESIYKLFVELLTWDHF